jgi:hypothetical protein
VFNIFKKPNKHILYKGFNLNHTDFELFFGKKDIKLNDIVNIKITNVTPWYEDRNRARREIQYQGVLVKGIFFDKNLDIDYNIKSGHYTVQIIFNNVLHY